MGVKLTFSTADGGPVGSLFANVANPREALEDFGAYKRRQIVLSMGAYPPASSPGEPPHRRTTHFSQTFTYDVGDNGLKLQVGTNDVRAALLQFGGTITARAGSALTIPVHPDAQGKRASDFDLTLVPRKGKPALLVRKVERRKKLVREDIMFVLVASVTVAARPYLEWTDADVNYLLTALQKRFGTN